MDSEQLENVYDIGYYLKRKIQDYKIPNYYSDVPIEFFNNYNEIIDYILKYTQENDLDDISLKRNGLFLALLHDLIKYLDHARIEDIPIELVDILEDILKKYSEDAKLFLKGSYHYNYSYIDVQSLIKETLENSDFYEDISEILGKKIGVITFPITHKDNLLLNSVLSHELGHFLNDIKQISKDIDFKIDTTLMTNLIDEIDKRITDEFKEIAKTDDVKKMPLEFFFQKEVVRTEMSEKLSKILNFWMEEFIADTIAIYLFGPSYFFAFCNLSCSITNEYSYSDDHPPFFLRMIPICQTLKNLGYEKILSDYSIIKDKINKFCSMKNKSFKDEDDNQSGFLIKIHEILEKTSRDTIPIIITKVNEIIKPYLSKTRFKKEIEQLRKNIQNFIPPNEIFDEKLKTAPAHPISIINVGWISYILDIKNFYHSLDSKTKDDESDIRFTLNKLLSKALESSEIHRKISRGLKNG